MGKDSTLRYSNSTIQVDLRRLVNQIWKLLPMRENNEDWHKQLGQVLIELTGLDIMFDNLNLLILTSKLNGLQHAETSFDDYRTAIFSSISILTEEIRKLDS